MGMVAKEQDGVVTIQLGGSFDVSQYEKFKTICKKYDSSENRFKIDFAKTLYMDSSALGMLLLLREQTKGDKERVKLVNVSGTVNKILEVAHFNQLFTICEDGAD
ncbi:anti-anti-sigma regulatory factor [Thiomicrorhabdus immobilis]|uniref:Anti-anti-sigma regulatory factor n=1 Tax=Thiomicrorhabdus immobilis TaxID=2791037 RepID=A0ABN6CZ99_9GAMM|nr:STAS domain-containing protein [Thiomicrorhabdus immobilis]BCN93225.1 anti-anti-sigma regulatory factor [Thiomicrorhabdus immobilis]